MRNDTDSDFHRQLLKAKSSDVPLHCLQEARLSKTSIAAGANGHLLVLVQHHYLPFERTVITPLRRGVSHLLVPVPRACRTTVQERTAD